MVDALKEVWSDDAAALPFTAPVATVDGP